MKQNILRLDEVNLTNACCYDHNKLVRYNISARLTYSPDTDLVLSNEHSHIIVRSRSLCGKNKWRGPAKRQLNHLKFLP